MKKQIIGACITTTVALVLIVGLEVAARTVRLVRNMAAGPQERPISLKQDWGKQYSADERRAPHSQYVPYVEFRDAPYASATINTDNEGKRRVPQSCANEHTLTVLMFGGSTMFGTGVPDQFTIPGYLAEILNREGRCIEVVNYGAEWWQSSQSVVQLLETLKKGGGPRLAVFYDGINDVDAVSYGGVPGGIAPEVELFLKHGFAASNDHDTIVTSIAQNSVLVRAMRTLLFPDRAKTPSNTFAVDKARMPELANAIASVYATNVRTASALAREYGFEVYFFLQPFPLIAEKPTTALEKAEFRTRTGRRDGEPDFIRLCYAMLRENPYLKSHPRFYDISTMFDGLTEELYLDEEHLLPRGNRLVAERIAREISLPHRQP